MPIFVLSANGFSGGLAIFWDVHIQLNLVSPPTLYQTDMYLTDGDNRFCFTYVYGNPMVKYHNRQWNDMISQIEVGY